MKRNLALPQHLSYASYLLSSLWKRNLRSSLIFVHSTKSVLYNMFSRTDRIGSSCLFQSLLTLHSSSKMLISAREQHFYILHDLILQWAVLYTSSVSLLFKRHHLLHPQFNQLHIILFHVIYQFYLSAFFPSYSAFFNKYSDTQSLCELDITDHQCRSRFEQNSHSFPRTPHPHPLLSPSVLRVQETVPSFT